MQRMPGIDAGFLYMETPTLHMHTLKISYLDTSTVPGGYSFARFQQELGARLPLLPPLRRRVVTVPLWLHHPVWVEDRAVDLDRHVRRLQVPAPGDRAQVEALIGAFASAGLDRSRPLWEIVVLEGLPDDRVVVVAKIHHAVADGAAATALLANVMDGAIDAVGARDAVPSVGAGGALDAVGAGTVAVGADAARPADARPAPPSRALLEPTPARGRLLREALVAVAHLLAAVPALVRTTVGGLRGARAVRRGATVRTPRPVLDVPRTSFNGAITARRVFAAESLSLDQIREVRVAFGVTVTDVVLAVIGGALRAELAAHGEVPDRSLVASVPVGTDAPGVPARLSGNRVSSIFTVVGTDRADPVERLRAVAAVSAHAKAVQRALGMDLMQSWVEFTPPWPLAVFMRGYSRTRAADRHPPPANLVVSSVPGPTVPVTIGGARLTELYSVGPILEGIGLNVTVWSYQDRMNFSALACPDRLPYLRALVDRFPAALAELVAAARREPVGGFAAPPAAAAKP